MKAVIGVITYFKKILKILTVIDVITSFRNFQKNIHP